MNAETTGRMWFTAMDDRLMILPNQKDKLFYLWEVDLRCGETKRLGVKHKWNG